MIDNIEEDKRLEYLKGHEEGVLAGLSLARLVIKNMPHSPACFPTLSDYEQNKRTVIDIDDLILEQYNIYK